MNRTPQHGDAGPPTQLPRIWDDELNSLMHRTVHAYDLIVTYERDSCGGTRWSSENIEYIRATGIYLHRDVDCLKRWRVEVAKYGVQDDATAEKIQEDIESVRAYCEHLQQLIKSTERVPLLQRITRDDVEQTRTQEGQGKESLWADRGKRVVYGGSNHDADTSRAQEPSPSSSRPRRSRRAGRRGQGRSDHYQPA